MTIHEINIDKAYFDHVLNGDKTFEIRNNDRAYQKGDRVLMTKMDGRVYAFPKRTVEADIGFVTPYMQKEGIVVFSLLNVKLVEDD